MIGDLHKLNELYIKWNKTDKSERFGQYLSNNSDFLIPQNIYNSKNYYEVYDFVVGSMEKQND